MAQLSGSKMFNALALGAKALLVILPVTPKYFYSICYLEQQNNDRIHVGHNVLCSAWSQLYRLAEKASRWGMTNLHRPTLLNIGIFSSSCWIQLEYNQKAKKYFYFISILQYMKQQHFSSK